MIRYSYMGWLVIIVVMLVIISAGGVLAQEPSTPPPIAPGSREELPFLALPSSSPQSVRDETDLRGFDWSEIVFQSLKDGNWEIYKGAYPPFYITRLTNSPAADIQPRLNRGATQIVFASDRRGNYDLYLMKVDGSDVRQLTSAPKDDVNPVWSYDGKQIAFQSYRDGQAEIYLMKADGSDQRRLTVQPGYDGLPTWSPDGSKLAFVSDQGGTYQIYVIGSDGSGRQQLSSQTVALNPVWSPDGTKIVFNADGDNNGWLEPWIMNADGSGQRMLYNPYPQSRRGEGLDWIVRGWSPDNYYITLTEVHYKSDRGTWYWTRAYMSATHFTDTSAGGPSLTSSSDVDWHPDWQTTDPFAPQSQVDALPALSRASSFGIHWDGADMGGSGVDTFDIQYQLHGTQGWQDLQTGVLEHSAPYEAVAGTTVGFRSRARDHIPNVESWPDRPDAVTAFYGWQFSGHLSDNRGTPLEKGPLEIAPAPLYPVSTTADGTYQAWLVAAGPHTLTFQDPNYSAPPPTVRSAERFEALYLLPKDNVIQNGSFEAAGTPTAWQVSGSLPVQVTNASFATGGKALVLGQTCPAPCLSEPELLVIDGEPVDVSTSTLSIDGVVDHQGNVHAVWYRWGDGSNSQIMYTRRYPNGSWMKPISIAATGLYHYSIEPLLAIDQADTLHTAWRDGNGLRYSQQIGGGSWSPPQIIGADFQGANDYPVDMAADRQGHLHILVHGHLNGYHFEKDQQGRWISRLQIFEEGQYPQMAIGADDSLHIVWIESYPNGQRLLYRVRGPDRRWGSAVVVMDVRYAFVPAPQQLVFDADGNLHLFLSGASHIMKPPAAPWTEPLNLPILGTPVIQPDRQGALQVLSSYVPNQDWQIRELYYFQFLPGSGWTEPLQLPDIETRDVVDLVIENDNFLHLLSAAFPHKAYYQHTQAAGISGRAQISQTITLPTTMQNATLSFMGRARGDVPGDPTGLTAYVTNGTGTTAVFSKSLNADWQLYWADLQAWTGQTVTLTFMLEQAAEAPFMQAYLDDIAVGSAYTDIRIGLQGETVALPGDLVAYQIDFANQSGVEAEAVTITALLPDELIAQAADGGTIISPHKIIWQPATLPADGQVQLLTFTAKLDPAAPLLKTIPTTVQIETTSIELETHNNRRVAALFIGHRLFLPFTGR